MRNITLKLYSKEFKNDLQDLLCKFSEEVFDEGTCDLEQFVDNHYAIYLAVKNGTVLGFSSFAINNYFGLRPTTMGNTYIYILPEHRNTKAMYLLSVQAGKVCDETNLPLEHYYGSDDSLKLSGRLKGKLLYQVFLYEVEEVRTVYKQLSKSIKIKE